MPCERSQVQSPATPVKGSQMGGDVKDPSPVRPRRATTADLDGPKLV